MSQINSEKAARVYQYVMIAATLCIIFAVICRFPIATLKTDFLLLSCFTFILSSRLVLGLPGTNLYVMLSDSVFYFVLLLYGGESAILLAFSDALITSLKIREKGSSMSLRTALFNSALYTFAVGGAVCVIPFADFLSSLINPVASGAVSGLPRLASRLICMCAASIVLSATLGSVRLSIKNQTNYFAVLKENLYGNTLTYMIGAVLGGTGFFYFESYGWQSIAVLTLIVSGCYYVFNYYVERLQKSINDLQQTNEALQDSNERNRHAALHDMLTALPNRAHFCERLKEKLDPLNSVTTRFAVLFLDLDRFKSVNDNLGHAIGDELLINVGKRLWSVIRKEGGDIIARFGGDEYAILLNHLEHDRDVENVAERIKETLSNPFQIKGYKVVTTPSIGIVIGGAEHKLPEDLLRDADIAMYHAKESKKSFELFRPEMGLKAGSILEIENGLRSAIENDELRVFYQPIIALGAGRLVGFEALMRWEHPTRGMVSPLDFIPIAEDSGLIIPMTLWILRKSCEQLSRWQYQHRNHKHLFISVNLSSQNFAQPDLVDQIRRILADTRLEPHHLKLEITESAMMVNIEETIEIMRQLRELNVQLSIDDFGTGYSSFSYLHEFPVDTLKIDRSFVKRMHEGDEIVKTVITLANSLNLEVIAEGIEEVSQLNQLRQLGCKYAQGFLMSKPLPHEVMSELLGKKQNWLPDDVAILKNSLADVYYLSEKAINRNSPVVSVTSEHAN